MNKDQTPDLSGKCVSITIMDDGDSHDICDPMFEYQGGRLFIVGRVPMNSTESGWTTNHAVAVAWDRVTDYFVFGNEEDYQKAVAISEKNAKLEGEIAKNS